MSKEQTHTTGSANPSGRGRWVIYLLAGMLLLLAGIFLLLMKGTSLGLGGFGSAQMAAAQYTSKDVVGDLGGMPVLIPRHMAEFVEYEGDPGWGGKRKGSVPERTYQSRLTSFGVQFRYPDMATLSSPEMWNDKRSKTIYNTDWMSFGIITGHHYMGNGWLDEHTNYDLEKGVAIKYAYVRQPHSEHGLESYLLVNRETGEAKSVSVIDGSLFIDRDASGRVTSRIRCSTKTHLAAPCSHEFSMEFDGVHAAVDISYRRPMLENWRDIQAKVRAMILSFKTPAESAAIAPSNSTTRVCLVSDPIIFGNAKKNLQS